MTPFPHLASPGLPDPDSLPQFYDSVAVKRGLAWVIDVILIALLAIFLSAFTFFTALLIFPILYAVTSFTFRVISISIGSATPGMALLGIEFRNRLGERFGFGEAFAHTLAYAVSLAIFPVQLFSVVLMLVSPRAQGLTDHLFGSAAINRPAN